MSEHHDVDDPCASFGPVQRYALVWFFAVLIIGGTLTFQLAKIDRWMFDHNGEHLDNTAYRENRRAFTSLPSEQIDKRQRSTYAAAAELASGESE